MPHLSKHYGATELIKVLELEGKGSVPGAVKSIKYL